MNMEKLNRWIAKNAIAVYTASVLPAFLIAIWAIRRWYGPWVLLIYLLLFGWIIGSSRFIFGRGSALLKAPVDTLMNACDPYPYLEEAETQRSYSGNRSMKLGHITTLATALLEVGDYDRMDALLTSTPEETVRGAHPANQVVYCGLAANIYARQKNLQEMELWHDRLLTAYQKVKLQKHRAWLEPMMVSHHAAYRYARQEYAQGLQLLEDFPVRTLRDGVVQAYSLAKFHLALNEKETAREHLDFVIKNGNKLYVVTEARALLAKINSEE